MRDKKILIFVAVILTVIVCAVAGIVFSNSNKNEIDDTTTTTTKESTTEGTELQTLPKTEATAPKIEISNKDKETFEEMLGQILWHTFDPKDPPHGDEGYSGKEYALYNWEDFDSTSSNAKEYAYGKLLTGYQPLVITLAEIFNWEDFEMTDCWDGDEDPKALYDEFYRVVDDEYVDLSLKTIFNVKPDHDYVLNSESEEVYAYYHDGNYYCCGEEGGDGAGPEIEIKNIKAQNDGKYLIDATYYISDFEDKEKICDVKVTAEMKTVEGKKLWSFYKIEKQ